MNGKHALGILIEKVQRELNWSDRDLAQRAQHAGLELGKSNWSRLKNQPVRTFKPAHVKGLAIVLGQTETVVATAILSSMGIELEGYQDGNIASAVRNNTNLSNRDKRVMLSVFEALTAEEVVGNVEHPAPKITPHVIAMNEFELAADSERNRGKEIHERFQQMGEESQELPD